LLEDTLIPVKVLPSGGDTSYPGVIVKDGYVYLSYYANDPDLECSWSIGSFCRQKYYCKIYSKGIKRVGCKNL
jgi:hypothetical protein